MSASRIDQLTENTLRLQKLNLNLIQANNELIKRIDNLVSLFEEAAKNPSVVNNSEVVDLKSRINELTQENKRLARGLVLMENRIKNSKIRGKPLFGI